MQEFFQTPPSLGNQYDEDSVLRSYIKRKIPADALVEIEAELHRMGERAVTEIRELGEKAEASPPRHIPYDPWGKRIDQIEVSDAWKALDRISAEEKLIAIGYERKHGAFSRIHQFAKIYLFNPSSAIYTCPLAMTDGAARVIELYGDEHLKRTAFRHLTSSDPDEFWTSGQWMTERTGGSDVSNTSTIARLENGTYRLQGTKWFTSATTSQMAMTLARIEGDAPGSRGLSLFYLELRDEAGTLNKIRVNRLKDKLGTRALPTAELTLEGAAAVLVGGKGEGVKKISSLFNITRIYNACAALGYMRRGIALARSYAQKRRAFGKLLSEHPLHLETLAELQVEFEAALHLTFRTAELLGRDETGCATSEETATLRLLIPLVKLYTAKQAIHVASEVLESFGGAGYVEDTGLPRLLRDSQVLSIWEGTTNVLSLDALRAIQKEDAAGPFLNDLVKRLESVKHAGLSASVEKARSACKNLKLQLDSFGASSDEEQQIMARRFSYGMVQTYAASLLLEQADWSYRRGGGQRSLIAAIRWCARELVPSKLNFESQWQSGSRILALDLPE